MQGLIANYADSILPVDNAVALASGKLEARAVSTGHAPGAADSLIAGTALVNDLTIITRNLKHCQSFGVPVKSPDDIAISSAEADQ